MLLTRKFLLLCLLAGSMFTASAQRTYKPASVLATGNWFKISVAADGVYKLDVPFLNALGITGNIPSSALRVYGNGGGMLPESAGEKPVDDLEETALQVVDGGDGVLNGSDYVLFYGKGPDQWLKDSLSKRFTHKKNLYSDRAFYFVTVGGTGRRVAAAPALPGATATVGSFNERYFQELDTVNFLSSGKEWYGEEFSNAPGKTVSRSFVLPLQDMQAGAPATLISAVAARSVNVGSVFNVLVNGNPVQQIPVPGVSTGIYDLFAHQVQKDDVFAGPAAPTVHFIYTPGSFNSQGWLNWFEYHGRRALNLPTGGQLAFRDWNSVGTAVAEYLITGADAATQVWDVTDSQNPARMTGTLSAGTFRFSNDALRLREYICFSGAFRTPQAAGRVANQNLHATTEKDFLIVTYPDFLDQAERLAQFHQQRNGLRTVVVTTEQVFNEFASGAPDPTAIRDFAKLYRDRYAATWAGSGRYLLLFGRGSFDYKNRLLNNTSLVPVYESVSSLDPLSTYTSDDFFGFLDDHEDINTGVVVNLLDIGIGRVPARSRDEARQFVDKVLEYHTPASLGPWRTNVNFIADDEDYDLHLQDAESLSAAVNSVAPYLNLQKIYLDAFQQEGGSAGGRYPQANTMVNNNIYNGTLIWNYSGHGGPQRLAEEVIIDQSIVNQWNNQYRLPLFITGTCDFAPYDNPTVASLGENLLVRPKTGAIALMTTSRVVFAFSNRILNENYLRAALQPDASNRYKTLGEAVQAGKNFTYQNFGDVGNNRKFVLLGDPAMTLGFPELKLVATRINGRSIATATDTVRATELVTLEGEVQDAAGTLQTGYSGRVYLSLFDKVRTVTTLGNDPTSSPVSFPDQSSVLFRGKASAVNGKFSIRFRVPRDINFQYGRGKASLYAEDGVKEGSGYSTNIVIGSLAAGGSTDNQGPEIRAYLNDEQFASGGIVNPAPVLLVRLFDSSGINTGSSGIDHDIVATLDNNSNIYYVLNNFYETELDDYQRGKVRFQLPALSPGPHTLKIKAWDVMNNSSEYSLSFVVVESGELRLSHVLNYPNPFTTRTQFWFEHNQPGIELYARVEVFTVGGKLIKTLTRTINTPGNRSNEVEWDGRDDYGGRIGRGVYIYRLLVRTADGKTAEKWEKLVIL